MTLQNRVDPFGRLHAVPMRGLFMGNRGGCFHRADKTLLPTHWRSRRWIICVLSFKDRQRELMTPGQYTEVFFLDEATALSAGHRPCFECQRARARAFAKAVFANETVSADELDQVMAASVMKRLKGHTELAESALGGEPDGTMFRKNGEDFLIWQQRAHRWSFEGYGAALPLPDTGVVLTPSAARRAFRNGFTPRLYGSLQG